MSNPPSPVDALRARQQTDDCAPAVSGIETAIRRFTWFPEERHYTVATLWVAYTHLLTQHEHLTYAPRLGVFSGAPGSGKTVTLELLSKLCANGQPVGSLTAAAMLRVISIAEKEKDSGNYPVTLFPDELDNLYTATSQQEELTNILNQGYKRGLKIRKADNNDQTKLLEYDCFGPVAFAGLATAQLPDALLSRTFMIHMKKARKEESPSRYFSMRHDREMNDVRDAAIEWAAGTVEEVTPDDLFDILLDDRITEVTNGREHDLWSALWLTAALAGGAWPGRVLNALGCAKEDSREHVSLSRSARLLAVLREHYGDVPSSRRTSISKADIVDAALTLDATSFQRYHNNRDEITAEDVTPLMREHSLKTCTVRREGGTTKGYKWADLQDAWERALPAEDEEESAEEEEEEEEATEEGGDIFG